MFNKKELEFIRASLTTKGAAVPCENNGEVARIFIETLDKIERRLKTFETPTLCAVPSVNDPA